MKKILAFVLALTMVFALCTVSASAKAIMTGTTSQGDEEYYTVQDMLAQYPEIVANTPGYEKWETPVDYSDANNWLSLPEMADKAVDVIYFYPTCYSGDGEVYVADITDERMLTGAKSTLECQATAFADSCNIYAPFYRQLDGSYALTLSNEDNAALLRYSAAQDPTAALDYYFQNYNNGKPFILAGHSQGSENLTFLLADYMKEHPEYLKNMVAAYVIGYSVTKDFLAENTHLRFAEGANDTGVIVSWNTEGPENKDAHNAVLLDGAIAINPLNWMRNETFASVDENLGSLINGKLVAGVADAQVDTERGVVVTTADKSFAMQEPLNALFGPTCFHGQDYGFYYANIAQNAAERIAAFLAE